MNKYGAKKTTIDNIKFDSKAEAMYYSKLKVLKQGKCIKSFECQPEFVLLPPFQKGKKKYRGIKYIADFRVEHLDGSIEIVDVKGMKTQVYLLKRQLFENLYPDLTITEVSA